jgi:CO dehydrogenase/acetyl-CoA synthase epsilon subunit
MDSNIAGFLGFVMYDLVALIGITHCFYDESVIAFSLQTALKTPRQTLR